MTALVELKKLGKRYGSIKALREVDATIDGKIIGLLGPNGSGKSTLLKCLLGLVPYTGEARVLGLEARAHGTEIRDRVGYMPEQESFVSGMSAVEQCAYAGELSGLPRSEAIQRAHSALYYAGVDDKRYQPIDGYSTGLKQRVKLAQALVHDPEILFLDEPTNGLDPHSREDMLELIRALPERRGCSIILSTHLLPDVERICDHAVVMHLGVVRFVGPLGELRGTHATDFVVEVKEHPEKLAAALRDAGASCEIPSPIALRVDLPATATSALVFRCARDAAVQVRGLARRQESIEAAFLRVIGDAREVA